jgi:hypothetical protein
MRILKRRYVMKAIADKLVGLIIAVSLCLSVAACGTVNNASGAEASAAEEQSLSLE